MAVEKTLAEERNHEVLYRPKEGKKFQLLCLKGHEIVFYQNVKQHYEETMPRAGDAHYYSSGRP